MLKLVAPLMALLVLAGCSNLQPEPPAPVEWHNHQAQLSQLNQWQLSGKIAIRIADENETARLYWQQADDFSKIQLAGPLGRTAAALSGRPGDYTLVLDDPDHPYRAATPEQLMQRLFGRALPISQVLYWVRGLPAPGSTYQPTFSEGRLSQLQQDGWQVDYSRYQNVGAYNLPVRIKLMREDIRLILLTRDWQLPQKK